VLEKLAALDADAADARLRLAELAVEKQDWKGAAEHAAAMLAVNPLIAAPHRLLAQASEKLGERPAAIDANRALLTLGPLDRAEIHFRLATLLRSEEDLAGAKREVLQALEQAPRYLAAHQLLLELKRRLSDKQNDDKPETPPADVSAPPPSESESIEPATPKARQTGLPIDATPAPKTLSHDPPPSTR
jgi:tetratricopeptide (TPR) repeat protein